MLISLFTDASLCGAKFVGGWAAWAKSERGSLLKSGRFKDKMEGSYEAEMFAVANGIHAVTNSSIFQKGDDILLQCDNLGVIKTLRGDQGPKGARVREAVRVINEFTLDGGRLITKHIKAHIGTKTKRTWVHNECDKLARKRMEEMRRMTA